MNLCAVPFMGRRTPGTLCWKMSFHSFGEIQYTAAVIIAVDTLECKVLSGGKYSSCHPGSAHYVIFSGLSSFPLCPD